MKFYAILLFCCIIYYVDAQYCSGDRLKGIMAKCATEEEATADDIEDIFSEKKAASESAKCLRACLMQECKGMDVLGNLDPNIHKEYLELLSGGDVEKQTRIASVFEKCVKIPIVEGKVCATAENYMDCLFTNCKNCGWEKKHFHSV